MKSQWFRIFFFNYSFLQQWWCFIIGMKVQERRWYDVKYYIINIIIQEEEEEDMM